MSVVLQSSLLGRLDTYSKNASFLKMFSQLQIQNYFSSLWRILLIAP